MSADPKLYKILYETFKVELYELHQSLVQGILDLEQATTIDALEEKLKQLFRYSHNLKGAAKSVSQESIATQAHALEDLFTQWRNTKHFPNQKEISACLLQIDKLLEGFGTEKQTKIQEMHEVDELIKLPLTHIERVTAKANEFIIYQLKLANWLKDIDDVLKNFQQNTEQSQNTTALLKQLRIISNDGEQFLSSFTRSVHALQDDLKNMRMMPIDTILTPLLRLVRDLALSLNKSVELKIEGGEIEIDKAILDELKDPLQHMIRNAIDHGIETDNERKKSQKPIPALLLIKIVQESGKIKLSLSDDGRGIDPKIIRQQALSKGLYDEKTIDQIDDKKILNCIFKSGFSTQQNVTEISGRGVGLDIVLNNLQKIKGTIEVESRPNEGSVFTLTLPLTLATSRGVFFKLNEQTFMLPTLSLNAIYTIHFKDLKLVDNQYRFVVNGQPIPVKMLHHLLKLETKPTLENVTYTGIFLNDLTQHFILLVDTMIEERDCVVKSLPFPYTQLDYFIGVTLTGENKLVLVLDAFKLVKMASGDQSGWSISTENKLIKKRVLVVDDSLTTRALCSNALQAAGYDTVSTIDGKKAWNLIQNESFDCVITDVLMPEMDGFQLTALIKAEEKYQHIPVIIVSLLDSENDKQKGMDAGANAFIVKSEFDTNTLLKTMDALI